MTDSISRPPEENTDAAIEKRVRAKYNKVKPQDREEFTDLPTWVRTAIALHDLVGLTWKEAAAKCGRKPSSLDTYKQSPAGKAWRAEMTEASLDPKAMAEMALKAHGLGVTLDYLASYQKAIEAGDYKEVNKASQDLLDRIGITKKAPKGGSGAMTINLTLPGGASLEPIHVESDSQAMIEGEVELDWEIEDDA